MSNIKKQLVEVENLYDSNDFESAFVLLNKAVNNVDCTNSEKAEALNWKGIIVGGPAPYLTEYENDESGLIYFIKALEYDSYNIGALYNILNSFTSHDLRQAYTKSNKHMFIKAYDILRNELFDSLDDEMKEQLLNQTNQYHEFKKQI